MEITPDMTPAPSPSALVRLNDRLRVLAILTLAIDRELRGSSSLSACRSIEGLARSQS